MNAPFVMELVFGFGFDEVINDRMFGGPFQ